MHAGTGSKIKGIIIVTAIVYVIPGVMHALGGEGSALKCIHFLL
jgi:hypothetical protein